MADPALLGTIGGATLAAIATFIKIYKVDKRTKERDSEIVEALKVVKDIFQPPNGNGRDKGAPKSDGIPGFAPECLQRSKDHGERIRAAETKISGFESRFDGLNSKIESVRRDLKADFAELRKEIREQA